jgi:hypothetical protein
MTAFTHNDTSPLLVPIQNKVDKEGTKECVRTQVEPLMYDSSAKAFAILYPTRVAVWETN